MLTLALVDKVATEGGKDATIPKGEGERMSLRVGQGEPEIITVSRVDKWERELCRRRRGLTSGLRLG